MEHEILSGYLVGYKSQPKSFKETIPFLHFIQLEEERRPYSNRRMRGNRFLLSNFDGSSTCIAKAWVMKLDAFFLLHPVVEREVVEISALHLEGKEITWWFGHLSHERVTTFADFTQRVRKIFYKEKAKGEEPSPPLEVTCTSTDATREEHPLSLAVGGANTLEGGTLAAIQDVPKFHQGMPKFPLSVISVNLMGSCGNLPLHDQGST